MVIADHKIPVSFRLRDRPGRDRCKEMISIRSKILIVYSSLCDSIVFLKSFVFIVSCWSYASLMAMEFLQGIETIVPFFLHVIIAHNHIWEIYIFFFFWNVLVCNHRGQIMYDNNSVDIFRIWILKLMLDTWIYY